MGVGGCLASIKRGSKSSVNQSFTPPFFEKNIVLNIVKV